MALSGFPAPADLKTSSAPPPTVDTRSLVRWGQRAARSGDLEVAQRVFSLVTEVDPTNEEAWLWRAGTSREPSQTLRYLERVLALNPGNLRARRGLAEIEAQLPAASEPLPEGPPATLEPARRERSRQWLTWGVLPLAPSLLLLLVFQALPFQQPRSSAAPGQGSTFMVASPQGLAGSLQGGPASIAAVLRPPDPRTLGVGAQFVAPVPTANPQLGTRPQLAPLEPDGPEPLSPAQEIVAAPIAPGPALPPPTGNNPPDATLARAALATTPMPEERQLVADAPESTEQTPPALASELTWPEPVTSQQQTAPTALFEQFWVAVHRATGLWSGVGQGGELFRLVPPGVRFQVALPQKGPRLYVWDPATENYAYINALDVGPASPPTAEELALLRIGPPVPAPASKQPWVSVHRETGLWSGPAAGDLRFGLAPTGTPLQIALPQDGPRLYVWDPSTKNYAYVDATDVGPSLRPSAKPTAAAAVAPKVENSAPARNAFWSGTARVSMYTCVELGGCNRTASGIWPYEGVVAVDRRVIPLGSTVWIDGLGTFLAADTGSAIFGNRIDVFVQDYGRAIRWGVRYLNAAAYPRS